MVPYGLFAFFIKCRIDKRHEYGDRFSEAMIYQVIHRTGLFDIPIHIEYANSEKSLYVVFISCVNVLTNLVVNAHL